MARISRIYRGTPGSYRQRWSKSRARGFEDLPRLAFIGVITNPTVSITNTYHEDGRSGATSLLGDRSRLGD